MVAGRVCRKYRSLLDWAKKLKLLMTFRRVFFDRRKTQLTDLLDNDMVIGIYWVLANIYLLITCESFYYFLIFN